MLRQTTWLFISILALLTVLCATEAEREKPAESADAAEAVPEERENTAVQDRSSRTREIEEMEAQIELDRLMLQEREQRLVERAEALARRESELEAQQQEVREQYKKLSALRTSSYIVLFIGILFLVISLVLLFREGRTAAVERPQAEKGIRARAAAGAKESKAEAARVKKSPSPQAPKRTQRTKGTTEKRGTKGTTEKRGTRSSTGARTRSASATKPKGESKS